MTKFKYSKITLSRWTIFNAFAFMAFACVAFLPIQTRSEIFGNWEVDAPPGFDPFYALRATQQLSASDLHSIEYFPKLSVMCERWATGPYGHGRTDYKTLKVQIQWFTLLLPKDFGALETFLSTGVDPRAAFPRGNSVWVNFGRAWTATGGFSDLIKVGQDNSSPIKTVKITGLQKGFRFSAELLDTNEADSFLRAWSGDEHIPVVLQNSKGDDLSRAVDIKGIKSAVDKVLAFCGRDPL